MKESTSIMILLPVFEVKGLGSYPDNPIYFSAMTPITFEGEDYFLCEYSGNKAEELTGEAKHTYADYEATLPPTSYLLTVTLSKSKLEVGESLTYRIDSEPALNMPGNVVPVSITDRNGFHVGNLGVEFIDGIAQGTLKFDRDGDFMITEEAINYHSAEIGARLLLAGDSPAVRVYQLLNASIG